LLSAKRKRKLAKPAVSRPRAVSVVMLKFVFRIVLVPARPLKAFFALSLVPRATPAALRLVNRLVNRLALRLRPALLFALRLRLVLRLVLRLALRLRLVLRLALRRKLLRLVPRKKPLRSAVALFRLRKQRKLKKPLRPRLSKMKKPLRPRLSKMKKLRFFPTRILPLSPSNITRATALCSAKI